MCVEVAQKDARLSLTSNHSPYFSGETFISSSVSREFRGVHFTFTPFNSTPSRGVNFKKRVNPKFCRLVAFDLSG